MRQLESVETLTEEEKQLLRDVKSIVTRFAPEAVVILYGSAARGEHGPESDYDLLVLLDKPAPKQTLDEMRSAIYDLELERDAVLSLVTSTEDAWNSPLARVTPYHRNIDREGVVV